MTTIVEAEGLGKRYGSVWALRGCTLDLPAGRAIALVGPNGAGKTTLLQLVVGLLRPSEGRVRVCGQRPFEDPAAVLPHVAFVAQAQPLYDRLTGDELLTLGSKLNRKWHDGPMRERLRALRIPFDRPVGRLSGGQRSQIALAMSLAKQADILVLDEPLASLDPLARQEFLQTLMQAISGAGTTVLLSSHIVGELERVCDDLVILATAHVQLSAPIEEIIATHRRVIGPPASLPSLARIHPVVTSSGTERQVTAVVRAASAIFDPAWQIEPLTLEEIVLAYLSQSRMDDLGPAEAVA